MPQFQNSAKIVAHGPTRLSKPVHLQGGDKSSNHSIFTLHGAFPIFRILGCKTHLFKIPEAAWLYTNFPKAYQSQRKAPRGNFHIFHFFFPFPFHATFSDSERGGGSENRTPKRIGKINFSRCRVLLMHLKRSQSIVLTMALDSGG